MQLNKDLPKYMKLLIGFKLTNVATSTLLFLGFYFFTPGPNQFVDNLVLYCTPPLTLWNAYNAYGLWSRRKSGWITSVIWAVLAALVGLIYTISFLTPFGFPRAESPSSPPLAVIMLGLELLITWYLWSVKDAYLG